jgi:hypothetical protein
MDLGFFRRHQNRFAGHCAAGLDYGVLVATLEAIQSATPTAKAEVLNAGQGEAAMPSQDPLAELLLGGTGWRDAAAAQGGSFNPAQARLLRKAL